MRHVSRTHRVALDWLFDRINLDPKIHIKCVDTKNQLADILTKGNFTRDEWNNLLHLFNISIFGSASCPEAMSKRTQQRTGKRIVAKVEADVELDLAYCGKLSHSAEFECIKSPADTQSTQSARFECHSTVCRESCSWRCKSKWRSVKFSSAANRCKIERQCEGTRCYRNTKQDPSFSRMCKESCRWIFGHQRRGRLEEAAQSPRISCWPSTPRESLLELATTIRTQARRQNWGPQFEYDDMGNLYVGHPASRSSYGNT